MNGKVLLTVGVVIALLFSVVAIAKPGTVREVTVPVGAQVGPEHFETQVFYENVVIGGLNNYHSTTSAAGLGSFTLTAVEVDKRDSFVSWLPNNNITLTTMASTSAPFLGMKPGESFEQLWYNASTTAAATITFAAGTGVDLQEDEGGTVIINGLETARVTFLKKADTDVAVIVEPYQVGD